MKILPWFFLALFAAQGLYLIQATSPTTDEAAFHMVNGYVYLKTHDYRMSPANPPLTREWMALPWLALKPSLDLQNTAWREADSVPFSLKFFYQDNRRIADALLYSARAMVLLFGIGLGLVIYLWSRELYGDWGGLLSLAVFSFSPDFLAHSALATIDMGAAFFSTLSAYFLWKYLEKDRPVFFWALSVSLAAAFAAKYSTLFLGPVYLAVICYKKGLRVSLKSAAAFIGTAFLVIWAIYFFEFKPLLAGAVPRIEEKLGFVAAISDFLFRGDALMRERMQHFAMNAAIPIPSYLLGVAGIIRGHHSGFSHYAFGRWTTETQWYYYLFSFAVKMTIPFLALLGLRAVFWKKISDGSKNSAIILLAPVFTMFFLVSFDSFAMGVRYLLPVIPLLFVWIGGLAKLAPASKKWKWILSLLLAGHMASSLSVFPNELSFFNSFVGGTPGAYRFVRGSDLDWGQGLKALKRYTQEHSDGKIALRYFGTADPSFYGIDFEEISAEELQKPADKVYAISLFYLEHAPWTAALKPTALVGGSIAIYDLRSVRV